MIDMNAVSIFINDNKLFKAFKNYKCFKDLLQQFQSAVEFLMYAILKTHSDIIFTVSMISYYIFNSFKTHFKTVKKIFHYFKNIIYYYLIFHRDLQSLISYINSN